VSSFLAGFFATASAFVVFSLLFLEASQSVSLAETIPVVEVAASDEFGADDGALSFALSLGAAFFFVFAVLAFFAGGGAVDLRTATNEAGTAVEATFTFAWTL